MIKYFCDGCGTEVQATGRLSNFRALPNGKVLMVELTHKLEGVWNDGIFCRHCILDTVLPLDDRPKELPEEVPHPKFGLLQVVHKDGKNYRIRERNWNPALREWIYALCVAETYVLSSGESKLEAAC